MGYINGEYRLENGDVWRRNGPLGWWRIKFCTMPGYPEEQGGPGFAVDSTVGMGGWSRMGAFYPCCDTNGFLRAAKDRFLYYVGKWRGDGRTGYDKNPEAADLVRALCEPFLAECERDGIIIRHDEAWLTPGDVREAQSAGKMLYSPHYFSIHSPAKVREGFADDVREAERVLDEFESWMRRQGKGGGR